MVLTPVSLPPGRRCRRDARAGACAAGRAGRAPGTVTDGGPGRGRAGREEADGSDGSDGDVLGEGMLTAGTWCACCLAGVAEDRRGRV